MMSDGRKTQIVLLDEQKLEIIIQPRLYAGELLDIVASHFNLKEKEYFGLSFKDETGHYSWLQLDRKVLEHDLPKKSDFLVLFFTIRFFIETIGYLRDNSTIELFYLHARQAVYNGLLECESETAFQLGAYVLQASHGDYSDDVTVKPYIKKLPILPTSALQEHPSITYCEDQVLHQYRQLTGTTRGTAIVQYMTVAEGLPTYGIHYYEVKDRSAIPWWLGLSHRGILLFDYADKKIPRRVFAWKQLENLYFRDKKFSIEVHDPKRVVHALSSFNLYEDAIQEPIEQFDDLSDAISDPTTQVSVSRRTFGPGNVNVHAWFAASSTLTKSIWSMAVSQHQFYLDRKQSKSQLVQMRSLTDMAAHLSRSATSLHSSTGNTDMSRSNSSHSLSTNNSKTNLSSEQLEALHVAQKDLLAALKARRDALQDDLKTRTQQLKELCIKEGELTGELPADTPLAPGETPPQIRRRVGTAFVLSPNMINRSQASQDEEMLQRLELEQDLEQKIAIAARRLAEDRCVSKSVHRQRKQAYHRALGKLKVLEQKLAECRQYAGNLPVTSSLKEPSYKSHGSPMHPRHLPLPSTEAHMTIVTSPQVEVVEMQYGGGGGGGGDGGSCHRVAMPRTAYHYSPASPVSPASPAHQHRQALSRDSTPSPHSARRPMQTPGPRELAGCQRLPVRNDSWPLTGWRTEAPPGGGGGEQQEEAHNLYNLNQHSTYQYSSTDELQSPRGSPPLPPPPPDNNGDVPYVAYDSPGADSLSELTPSRFGSKRESHADQADSLYDFDSPVAGFMHGYSSFRSVHDADVTYRPPPPPHSGASTPDDCRPRPVRQQGPPPPPAGHTLAYQPSPPPYHRTDRTYLKAASASALPYQTSHASLPSPYPAVAAAAAAAAACRPLAETRPPANAYTSHVEVSKPFEMADFYKYSERLRRRRELDGSLLDSPHTDDELWPAGGSCSPSTPGGDIWPVPGGDDWPAPEHYENCEQGTPLDSRSDSHRLDDGRLSHDLHPQSAGEGRLSLGGVLGSPHTQSVAASFSEEMLTWFGDQQAPQSSSTLV